MFSAKYVLVLWTQYLTNQYDNHMAAIDQLSTCVALCWNIDFYCGFFPCIYNAKYGLYLPSFCWISLFMEPTHLGKKMSVQSWIAPGQRLHIQGPAQKGGEVSLLPCCLRASQLHWYKGCWVLAGALISNIYQKSFVSEQANAEKSIACFSYTGWFVVLLKSILSTGRRRGYAG